MESSPLTWKPLFANRLAGLSIALWLLIGGTIWCATAAGAEVVKPTIPPAPKRTDSRTSVLVPLPVEPGWQDLAFLAAIPAAMVVNHGAPSVVALDAAGAVTPEVEDYFRRYRPDAVFLLGNVANSLKIAERTCDVIKAGSADEAACALSARFWRTSATAVLAPEDDYEAGLIAAPLAARLGVPLLFASSKGLSPAAAGELRRLATKELLVVGKLTGGWQALKKPTLQMTELATARDVMTWARNKKMTVDYVVALNPLDRSKTVVKKLSLAGAMLAAGRKGLVSPLSFEVRWKIPFNGSVVPGQAPADPKQQDDLAKTGTIAFDGKKYAFTLRKEREFKVSIDLNGDSTFTGPGEGPFGTGDTVELDGKRHAISLKTEYGPGKADIRLTWPTAEQLAKDLQGDFHALGVTPTYLCLVGFPDAIPQAIFNERGVVSEVASDVVYANTDEDPFAEICLGRVIGENASFATLYASRALTYHDLLDADWKERASQARWENTIAKLFENVGLDASYHHTINDLKWLKPPTDGKGGRRDQTFDQASPLTQSLALAHNSHSSWKNLGETFDWNTRVLLSPVVVESGGCATAALDTEADYHSVVARLLRNGAISFTGNSRLGIAEGEVQRLEFWNGVLSGKTIGEAHKRSMDSAQVTVLDKKKDAAKYIYQLRIRTLFGDPALVMPLPGKPQSAASHCVFSNNRLTVHAPSEWWPVRMHVPEDWKKWTDKDLYVLRGAGTYSRSSWSSDQYNKEEVYVTAAFTTLRRVAKIEQVQNPPAPLGWNGAYYADQHADGSCTYRWSVRLADFHQEKGTVINKVDRLEYRITYQ